ncbi:MAG: hypothetical protein KatS3mg105_3257 [Gemmatales bacterium]|nr:MAG: hypothetical protein KatS3mg105_3257 [Gemmatales bacterium]
MFVALIPAAGKSRRMGQAKLALRLGQQTVLEHLVDALKKAGIEKVLIVVGPHVSQLAHAAERKNVQTLRLAEETPDMQATVVLGLRELQRLFQPADQDWLVLVPGDHPLVGSETLRELMVAAQSAAESIIVPTSAGRRGHPALIRWSHVPAILRFPANVGLNKYLRQFAEETLEYSVSGDDVLIDLDTPEDYRRLLERWNKE